MYRFILALLMILRFISDWAPSSASAVTTRSSSFFGELVSISSVSSVFYQPLAGVLTCLVCRNP